MSRRFCMVLLTGLFSVVVWAQGVDALSQLKADPRKSYGNDYPYPLKKLEMTKAPKGTILYQSLCPSWFTLLLDRQTLQGTGYHVGEGSREETVDC